QTVDLRRPVRQVQRDPVFGVPLRACELEVLGIAPLEVFCQVDAIICRTRLFAERHKLKLAAGIVGDHPLAETVADHAVADHHHGLPVLLCRDHFRVPVLALKTWPARAGPITISSSRATRIRTAQALYAGCRDSGSNIASVSRLVPRSCMGRNSTP